MRNANLPALRIGTIYTINKLFVKKLQLFTTVVNVLIVPRSVSSRGNNVQISGSALRGSAISG